MTLAEVEAGLSAALTQQADRLAHALRFGETLPSLIREGKDATAIAGLIHDDLVEAERIDADAAAHRQQWLQARTPTSMAIRRLCERLTELSQKLQECLVTAEREALARKAVVEPRLDMLVQTMRMRKTYGEVHRRSRAVPAVDSFKR